MTILTCSNLSKSYRGKRAVDGISLSLKRGEIYGLVGHNGSGKSTLLKMISGLILPDAGTIEAHGHVVIPGDTPRSLGALIESPGIIPSLSGFQNVLTRAVALGLADPRAATEEALGLVGLSCEQRMHARTYSLGMKQRLGIALAIVGSPSILLLDEPFNGIDPEGVRTIRLLLVDIAKCRGTAVLVSSHVIDQLDRMVTRYGVIREGRLLREVTSDEVRELCCDYTCIASPEPEKALAALERKLEGVRCSMMPDSSIRIEGLSATEDIGRILLEAGVPISGLFNHSHDTEDLFIDLMNGEDLRPTVTTCNQKQ